MLEVVIKLAIVIGCVVVAGYALGWSRESRAPRQEPEPEPVDDVDRSGRGWWKQRS